MHPGSWETSKAIEIFPSLKCTYVKMCCRFQKYTLQVQVRTTWRRNQTAKRLIKFEGVKRNFLNFAHDSLVSHKNIPFDIKFKTWSSLRSMFSKSKMLWSKSVKGSKGDNILKCVRRYVVKMYVSYVLCNKLVTWLLQIWCSKGHIIYFLQAGKRRCFQ